jgi:hypothetical protein
MQLIKKIVEVESDSEDDNQMYNTEYYDDNDHIDSDNEEVEKWHDEMSKSQKISNYYDFINEYQANYCDNDNDMQNRFKSNKDLQDITKIYMDANKDITTEDEKDKVLVLYINMIWKQQEIIQEIITIDNFEDYKKYF